jgi:hypothetical protein
MAKQPPRVWVVEMWDENRRRWEPCRGIGLTRDVAREVRDGWAARNPDDRFNVARYARVEPPRRRGTR